MKFYIAVGLISLFLQTPCYADQKDALRPATHIKELPQTLKTIKKTAKFPVLFPTKIKNKKGTVYYATPHRIKATEYWINISPERGCVVTPYDQAGPMWKRKNGKLVPHYCQMGLMWGRKNGKLFLDPVHNHQPGGKGVDILPEKIQLGDKTAYYTPDWTICYNNLSTSCFDSQIQWLEGDVLYVLSWAGVTKQELIDMALSAIASAKNTREH